MTTVMQILGTSTPVSESLAQNLGYVKAAIACRIFFYEQLDHKVCEASVGTIAKKLGMSAGTVSTNINWLLENKYIKVVGKHRKGGNQPNKYKVAKRFYVEIQRSADESQRSADESQRSADEIKRRDKEEIKEETTSSGEIDEKFSTVTTHYENEIGLLSPIIAQEIGDCIDDYPLDWIIEAINISAKQNKRRWSYVEGILRKWQTEGKQQKQNGNGRPQKERQKILDPMTGEWTGGYYTDGGS